MKTVADFKRAMVVGTKWKATHAYLSGAGAPSKPLGTRECGLANTVSFAFVNPESGELSYCDWPKKAEFSFENGVVTIVKEGFCKLTYEEVS